MGSIHGRGLGPISCGSPAPARHTAPAARALGSGRQARWVDGRSGRYSDDGVPDRRGSRPRPGPCESDAYAALAKIFKAQISQVSQDWQGHFSRVGNVGLNVTRRGDEHQPADPGLHRQGAQGGQGRSSTGRARGPTTAWPCSSACPPPRACARRSPRLDAEIKAQVDRGDSGATPTAKFMAYARAMEVHAGTRGAQRRSAHRRPPGRRACRRPSTWPRWWPSSPAPTPRSRSA